jgi:hypothetical protein
MVVIGPGHELTGYARFRVIVAPLVNQAFIKQLFKIVHRVTKRLSWS